MGLEPFPRVEGWLVRAKLFQASRPPTAGMESVTARSSRDQAEGPDDGFGQTVPSQNQISSRSWKKVLDMRVAEE